MIPGIILAAALLIMSSLLWIAWRYVQVMRGFWRRLQLEQLQLRLLRDESSEDIAKRKGSP